MGPIASPTPRARKIFLNVSENKSSDRKLSLTFVCPPFMSNIHFEGSGEHFDPLKRDWYQLHPTETSLEAWIISRALLKTHKLVHYALIFIYPYSQKRFYHYTECINTPALAGALPPVLPLGA